jgi:hypothetical protein
MFFLRHLANMSCMVPFWASTGSGFASIWGPRPKPRRPEEVVYSLNESCSHFTQCLFPPKLRQQHIQIISYGTCTSFIPFIHHLYAHIYIFYFHVSFIISLPRIFMAGRLPSVPCVRHTYCICRDFFLTMCVKLRPINFWDFRTWKSPLRLADIGHRKKKQKFSSFWFQTFLGTSIQKKNYFSQDNAL